MNNNNIIIISLMRFALFIFFDKYKTLINIKLIFFV